MKHFYRACIILAMGLFAAFSAQAAEFVTNSTGTVVYGTASALAIQKNTDSGNRVAVLYSSGWQYVADDAAWSKYAKLVAGVGARGVAVDSDPKGTVYVVAASNGVYCYSGASLINYPSRAQGETVAGDGCAYWTKVKALGQ
jgi:hypothetical protein